ncbi:TNT domain-containing protein [Nocardioides ganghwensis]|uniref:DUF4237 domain-containing protein n=1 Tax=Nocardioides ganghwensis TaxID=252230 RepID=A0A4Q2SLV5_9ACTN|nr:TNT domain-containing protein [Nocardioides ganghwensis]MBD3945013.1 TNT domain-containing protein [Nocardioides ganghwensis]RYC04988.1 DUF4237 domain-containing protein [Nocardioides ganghwensis]
MPDFEIEGNPGAIRSKAVLMEQKGQLFYDTGDALAKIDVSGWTGRAADEFREAHDLEPERWTKAGNGFKRAAAGLTTYAGALEDAQRRAAEARAEHERGQRESESARTQYDSYLGRMRAYWSSGGTDPAEPFVDWGDPIQQEALRALQAARADLDNAAATCAGEVRAGCADAPEEPNWLESGLKFVGGIFEGAGEAVWDLLTMVPFSPVNLVIDAYKLATGDLTPEELAKTYELDVENGWAMAQGIYTGLTTDPVGFGKELGKSLLDWDTWADDPARAIGHLVPDAIVAVATGGAGAVATRGGKMGMDLLDGLADLARFRHLDDLSDLGGLRRLDDGAPRSMFELDGDGPWRSLDDQLREPSYSSSNRSIIDDDYDIFGRNPETGQPYTRAEFEDAFRTTNERGETDWDWGRAAPNDGKVPGTDEIVDPHDVPRMDRIGGPNGAYFGDDGAMMSERSLPPDRLNFERNPWEINRDHPDLQDGSVRIEKSEVAPAFGQEGGGNQYRFLDADGTPLSQAELVERGIIDNPYRFDAGDAATGAAVTHGAQTADRLADEHRNEGAPR